MGIGRVSALVAALALVAGCSADASDSNDGSPKLFGDDASSGSSSSSSSSGGSSGNPGQPGQPTPNPTAIATNIDPDTADHPEVVYVIMDGNGDGMTWFCTGTLLTGDIVLTAAHCLQTDRFHNWRAIAPTLASRPEVDAASVEMYDPNWDDVTHPDLGILKLKSSIQLARYADVADVSSRVDNGQKTQVASIVRKAEQPEAPFKKTGTMTLSSTKKYDYTHGYGVPLFSEGGDSGAGMFLVQNGQMTHTVVAIEREPDPQRRLDQLTRIESEFIQWLAKRGVP